MLYHVADNLPDGSDALAGCLDAEHYHGGQWTALYQLRSSGCVDSLKGLRAELEEAVDMADIEHQGNLQALLHVVEQWLSVMRCDRCGGSGVLDTERGQKCCRNCAAVGYCERLWRQALEAVDA